jgi:hypothetical protein
MNAAAKNHPASKPSPAQPETVTRFVGNCQLCEGDQKLTTQNTMVHHGYKRPGDGEIHGDCPGVHVAPYEVSCEAIKAYVKDLRGALAATRARLAEIAAGEVTFFEKRDSKRDPRGYGYGRIFFTTSYSSFVTAGFTFDSELRSRESHLRYEASNLERDIAHREARIAAWKPMPIRTVEEIALKEQADKAERASVREAARATRDAKKAATRARVEALEARRKAARDAFKSRLVTIAAMPAGPARNAAADKLFDDMNSKKGRKEADIWGCSDLHCPELFVQVGLATISRGENNRNGHGDLFADFHRTDKTT